MYDKRPPLPSRRRTETSSFESTENRYMKGLNTKKNQVGEHLIETAEHVYDKLDEDQETSAPIVSDDYTENYLQPIYSQAKADTRRERIRRWNLNKTVKQRLLTEDGENTKTVNETKKHESNCNASTIVIILLLSVATCFCVFRFSTTGATSTPPDSVTSKSESKCNTIIMEEIATIKRKVERQDLRIKDLTNQLLEMTDLVKYLSNQIDLLKLYMKNSSFRRDTMHQV